MVVGTVAQEGLPRGTDRIADLAAISRGKWIQVLIAG